MSYVRPACSFGDNFRSQQPAFPKNALEAFALVLLQSTLKGHVLYFSWFTKLYLSINTLQVVLHLSSLLVWSSGCQRGTILTASCPLHVIHQAMLSTRP